MLNWQRVHDERRVKIGGKVYGGRRRKRGPLHIACQQWAAERRRLKRNKARR